MCIFIQLDARLGWSWAGSGPRIIATAHAFENDARQFSAGYNAFLGGLLSLLGREQVLAGACLGHSVAELGAPILKVVVDKVSDLRGLLLKSLLFFALPPFAVLALQIFADRFKVHSNKAQDLRNNLIAGVQLHRPAHIESRNSGLILAQRRHFKRSEQIFGKRLSFTTRQRGFMPHALTENSDAPEFLVERGLGHLDDESSIAEHTFIFRALGREAMLLIDVGLDERAFVVIDDNGRIRPMRDVALDMPYHGRDIDLLEENVLDLDQRPIGRTRMDFPVKNLNGDVFAVFAGFDVFARQLKPNATAADVRAMTVGEAKAIPMMVTVADPESIEGKILAVFDQYGSVMDGEELAERCIGAGVNATSFYIYRLMSPVIASLGKGVYCKVGAEVAPGVIEDILSRRRSTPRSTDHGWMPNGNLWFGLELPRSVITTGGLRLAQFVADLVQGEWDVQLPDGAIYDRVTCRDLFIWSFRKAFAVLGAEPDDLMALEFNKKTRRVMVRIGGPGLFEAIQEPENMNADDAGEDA